MKLWMAVQNAENGMVLGWLGGTQGHGQCHHSMPPFGFNRNYSMCLPCIQNIAGYLLKVADFDPTCIWSPRMW